MKSNIEKNLSKKPPHSLITKFLYVRQKSTIKLPLLLIKYEIVPNFDNYYYYIWTKKNVKNNKLSGTILDTLHGTKKNLDLEADKEIDQVILNHITTLSNCIKCNFNSYFYIKSKKLFIVGKKLLFFDKINHKLKYVDIIPFFPNLLTPNHYITSCELENVVYLCVMQIYFNKNYIAPFVVCLDNNEKYNINITPKLLIDNHTLFDIQLFNSNNTIYLLARYYPVCLKLLKLKSNKNTDNNKLIHYQKVLDSQFHDLKFNIFTISNQVYAVFDNGEIINFNSGEIYKTCHYTLFSTTQLNHKKIILFSMENNIAYSFDGCQLIQIKIF